MHTAYMKTVANISSQHNTARQTCITTETVKAVTTLCCTYITDTVVIKYKKAFQNKKKFF